MDAGMGDRGEEFAPWQTQNPPTDLIVASFSAVAAAGYWLLRAVPRVTRERLMGMSPATGSLPCRLVNFDSDLSPLRRYGVAEK